MQMEMIQLHALAQILVHTVYGFRRHANVAIQCTREWVEANEETKLIKYEIARTAQNELSHLFGKYVVKPAVLTKWLLETQPFP
jgi:hypothetical protein